VQDFSVDALVRDLEAVVERLAVPSVRLTGFSIGGAIALAYAGRHPERVSHLIVVNGFDRGADTNSPKLAALLELAATDWAFASEGIIRVFAGWQDEEASRAAAAFLRESIHPRQLAALADQMHTWDVTADLPRISAKTLIVQHKDNPAVGPQVAPRLAALIPHCEVAMLDGPMAPFLDAEALSLFARFLTDAPATAGVRRLRTDVRHRTAIILFADIVGSTELTEQLGDLGYHQRTSALDASMRQIVSAAGGKPVEGKLLGDGMLALFTAARDAIIAAGRCADASAAVGLRLRLGIHAGDVIPDAGDVHGGAVNIAARIAAAAAPGEVLISGVVRALARTSVDVPLEDRGEHRLKGVAEAQHLYRVCAPEGKATR